MIKFEQVGVNKQYRATSRQQALELFDHSCNTCTCRGIALSCDKCAIATVHSLVMSVFDEIEDYAE